MKGCPRPTRARADALLAGAAEPHATHDLAGTDLKRHRCEIAGRKLREREDRSARAGDPARSAARRLMQMADHTRDELALAQARRRTMM